MSPFPLRYVLNIMNRLGRAVQLQLGAEGSVRAAPSVFVLVDQRDGFEVGYWACESATSARQTPSSPPSPEG